MPVLCIACKVQKGGDVAVVFTHIGGGRIRIALSRPMHLQLPFPTFQLFSITVGTKVLSLRSAIEGTVVPSAAFLLEAVHRTNSALSFGFVLPEPTMGHWVLIRKLQTVPDVAGVEAIGVCVRLVFPWHVVGEGVYGIDGTNPRHAGRAVALRGQ